MNKGLATINGIVNPNYPYDSSTTFTDGVAQTAPINNAGSQLYYDAFLNGGTITLDTSATVQKLSLLAGTLNVASGTPTLTVNDNLVLGGGAFNGAGTINALTTSTVALANTISGGAKIISAAAVPWIDGGAVTVTGTGSQWTTSAGVTLDRTAARVR